jgi:hypothetical protein
MIKGRIIPTAEIAMALAAFIDFSRTKRKVLRPNAIIDGIIPTTKKDVRSPHIESTIASTTIC